MPIDDSKDEIEVIECFNLYSDFSSLRSIIKIGPLLCLFDRCSYVQSVTKISIHT